MPLFQVAVLRRPTKKQVEEEGKKEELLVQPKFVLAANDKQAGMMVSREIPLDADLDNTEVLVSPFV